MLSCISATKSKRLLWLGPGGHDASSDSLCVPMAPRGVLASPAAEAIWIDRLARGDGTRIVEGSSGRVRGRCRKLSCWRVPDPPVLSSLDPGRKANPACRLTRARLPCIETASARRRPALLSPGRSRQQAGRLGSPGGRYVVRARHMKAVLRRRHPFTRTQSHGEPERVPDQSPTGWKLSQRGGGPGAAGSLDGPS